MFAVFRVFIVLIYAILVCLLGCFYCLFSPKNPRHVMTFGHLFGRLAPVLGIKMQMRLLNNTTQYGPCIYIANHQNNYDMVTISNAVQSGTVSVGKKSLLWVPFFGLLYWITGNILIDRSNKSKAHDTIAQVAEQIKARQLSVWMFPEGTRSRGRGLLPFKMGAFHAAIAAGVPIIPVCMSNTHDLVKLNRRHNGTVIVEMLEPIETKNYKPQQVRELAEHCRQLMAARIDALSLEAGHALK